MARITVQDCMSVIKNRFELVILASQRTRDLYSGAAKAIECNDREHVTSLREIAANLLDLDALRNSVIKKVKSGDDYSENSIINIQPQSFDELFVSENEDDDQKHTGVVDISFGSDLFAGQDVVDLKD